ncbi:MAG TPA: hypothetical protein VM938_00500 [Acidimicrobiales bacterium]|nr:hypothetical protein [Acidimicrobiales bacterium]
MGMRLRLLLVIVVASLGMAVPPAEAVSGGTIVLSGLHHFQWPINAVGPPVLPTTPFVYQGMCAEVVVHASGSKPPTAVGNCTVQYEGLYTGHCFAGWGIGYGVYVDSFGQPHPIEVTFVVTGPVWRFAWSVDKPSTGETGHATGNGEWLPDPVACATSGTQTARAAAHVTVALY